MSLDDDILIERFLRGELSLEESDSFTKRINKDERFRACYLLEKQLLEGLNKKSWSFATNESTDAIKEYDNLFKDDVSQNLKAELKKGLIKYQSKRRKIKLKLMFSAAAIVLLAVVVNFFFFKPIASRDKLYAEYMEIEKLTSFRSRGETEQDKELIRAEIKFIDKQYKEALILFNQSLEKDGNNGLIYIYMGISYIELKAYDKAENSLNELINSNLIDAEKGLWYKSLLFIKSNEMDQSKKLLNKIIENSYYKNEEAKELLLKMRHLEK